MKISPKDLQKKIAGLEPKVRLRLAIGGALLVGVILFAACGGCGRRTPGGGSAAVPSGSTSASSAVGSSLEIDAASLRDPLMWAHAKDGDVEDLTMLATHEGAMGLVEAASSDPTLRPTAIRAMGYARGWAQLPFLAKAATGKEDEEARLALDATLELATRPRRAEDLEDADELREGCEGLGGLARDATRARPRRIAAIRALRMMPCPPTKQGEKQAELPTDLDAK